MCLFSVLSTHLLTWIVFFGDTLKDLCSPRTECLMACFTVSVKIGHGAVELNSSASTTKGTELQRLIKQCRSQQRHWHTMAASNMTRHINYVSLLIAEVLMLFIILNSLFTDPHAVWCHCDTHSHCQPLWQDTQGHFVVFICPIKLLSWLTVSTFSPLSCVPLSRLLCPSASRWQSPSPSAASVWGPRSRIVIRGRRNSSPALTVAIVVSAPLWPVRPLQTP